MRKVYHEHSTCESCGHNHDHHEHEETSNKLQLAKIIIGAILIVFGMLADKYGFLPFNVIFVYLAAYLVVGLEVVIKAIINIFHGKFFDETFLMSLATICAFIVAGEESGIDYNEAVLVMELFQIGEFIEDIAVDKSHKSVESLLSMKEVVVHKISDKEIIDSKVTDINIRDFILVKPGERIPLDGIILEGHGNVDTSPLTGESIPTYKKEKDEVLSGSINIEGTLKIKITKRYDDSTVNKILEYIENATISKTQSEKFVARFSKIYTPCVVIAAVLVVIIPTLLFHQPLHDWLYKACIFLVVSCPCAIVISVPLAYFIGIGVSSKKGILMKGSNYLDIINKMDTILFDKTGTLTKGKLFVKEFKLKNNNLITKVCLLESLSNHPVAKAIAHLNGENIKDHKIENFKETSGVGVEGIVDGYFIEVNNKKPKPLNIKNKYGSISYVYINNEYYGYILVSDVIKDDTLSAVLKLKEDGIKTVMVSGDNKNNAESIAKELGINEVHSELLPKDKVDVLDIYLKDKKGSVGYVGDGINDTPVIAKSDIGFSMGSLGSDAAIEVSDVVIMNDSLLSIINAKEISKKTIEIVNENIIAVLIVKAVALIWGLFGQLPMWVAILSDVGICVLAILNCLRLFALSKK